MEPCSYQLSRANPVRAMPEDSIAKIPREGGLVATPACQRCRAATVFRIVYDDVPAPLRKAKWIWPGLGFHDLHNGYALFRKEFSLRAVPRRALAWVTADQCYQLWVNGAMVSRGPARGYQENWSYDEVDMRKRLHRGRNIIAIRAYNCGHSTFGYRTEGFAGLLFAAKLGALEIFSDASWPCRRQCEIHRDTVPYSLQLPGHQEWVDLRAGDPAWSDVEYDDGQWERSPEERAWNAPPYGSLEARGIPLMREHRIRPTALIGTGCGKSAKDYATTRDLAALRAGENLRHSPHPGQSAHEVRVPAGTSGHFQSFLFDFGQVVVGSPILTVSGARGGEIIDFLGVEHMDEKALAPFQPVDDHSKARLANRLVCRKGDNTHQFFHHLGFRYALVTVRDNSGDLRISLELAACGYPMDGSGAFECSDPLLQKIWNASAHTQRICALDAYVDTPWREQAQWWGDARIQAWNTFHLSGDARLLRRGIRSIAGQITPDGLTFGHAPTMAHNCVLPDFSLIWLLTLWDHYWQTGSTEALATHADRVATILGYFRNHIDPRTGLVAYDPRYWLFLDWTTIQRDGQPALLNLWLLFALQKMESLVPLTGLPTDFCGVAAWRKRLTASIRKHLLRPDGLVCDGLLPDGKPSKSTSIQAQTLARLCHLSGFRARHALDALLLPWVRGEQATDAPPSAYWCVYPLDWLAEAGYGGEVLAFLRRHWAVMADYGSTFEDYNPDQPAPGHLSRSHAWSAHPVFLLARILGGIRQTAPAWREVSVQPQFLIDRAEANVPTPHGDLLVRWNRSGPKCDVQIAAPEGIRVRAASKFRLLRP